MIDKEILKQKKKLQHVRNKLKSLNSIQTLFIYENNENKKLVQISNSLTKIGYYSNETKPISRLNIKSKEKELFIWIQSCINLYDEEILYIMIDGIWVKIKILNTTSFIKEVWNMDNSKYICVVNETMDLLLEVGSDNRDEENYLFDVYSLE